MSTPVSANHPVARQRAQHDWSQAELARRAGIPRTTISAIEGERLTPSVTAALALARALECSVEELFGGGSRSSRAGPQWAWTPRAGPCRYWAADVNEQRLLYPVEGLALNARPHDGVWQRDVECDAGAACAGTTLVVACCDPAAGLLATEYAKASGFRCLVFPRCGGQALGLLKRGLIHVAGLHRSTQEQPTLNAETVRARLGDGFRLVRVAHWQEGLAVTADNRARSPQEVVRSTRRWAMREPGSAARECLDALCATTTGRTVASHAAVAEAVRGGWAEAGVCVQLAAEDAGLNFLPLRQETADFCFPASSQHDARIQALVRLLRSRSYRRLIAELPGYAARETGELLNA